MITVQTEHPIAIDSNDHLFPWGSLNDNTSCPAFLRACEAFNQNRPLRYLDLGCSGGQLVREFIEAGHVAFGVDGAMAAARDNWKMYPSNYAHCDISRPFSLGETFDIISAWEVLEHISEDRLPVFFQNVRDHLKPASGIFVCSISTKADVVNDVVYHQTVKPLEWWLGVFTGLCIVPSPFKAEEYARTDGSSVHLVAMRGL